MDACYSHFRTITKGCLNTSFTSHMRLSSSVNPSALQDFMNGRLCNQDPKPKVLGGPGPVRNRVVSRLAMVIITVEADVRLLITNLGPPSRLPDKDQGFTSDQCHDSWKGNCQYKTKGPKCQKVDYLQFGFCISNRNSYGLRRYSCLATRALWTKPSALRSRAG